jgi:Transcriptional regulators
MATVKLIAERLKVSPATVSRGLRGGRGVKPETLEKILSAAEDLGYSRPAVSGVVRSVALIVTTMPDGEPYELARRQILVINQEIAKRGWRLHPVPVPGFGDGGEAVLADFIKREGVNGVKIDGCLMVGSLPGSLRAGFHPRLQQTFKGRVVMTCRHDIQNGLSGVALMDYAGGQRAAQLLIDAGHRRVGWIGSLGSESNADERLSGVLSMLRRNEGKLTQQLWLNDADPLPISLLGRKLLEQLPERREEWPTAWACSTDWLAAKLIAWARNEGLRVPEDLSVVAFDNAKNSEELAEMVMTTIVFPYEQVARCAVELLERQINAEDASPIIWTLPPQVREGQSIGPVGAGTLVRKKA